MRIAYYTREVHSSGGIQRITVDKINLLAEAGHEILLITRCQGGLPAYFALDPSVRVVDLNIDYFRIRSTPNPIKRYFLKKKIRRDLKASLQDVLSKFKADIVVNTILAEEGEIISQLRDGSRKVIESHGIKYALLPPVSLDGRFGLIRKYFADRRKEAYERLPLSYDAFVLLSNDHISEWDVCPNIHVIPNMCMLNRGRKVSDLNHKVVSIIARLSEEKGVSELVNIWSIVAKYRTDWKLCIWGDGPLRREIQRQVQTLGLSESVCFEGETKNMEEVYLQSSIVCLTSRCEGFPMVLVEAQSYGIPIVSYDCPLGPRGIVHHGIDGFLVEVGNHELFAEYLLRLMQDVELRRSMGKNAFDASVAYLPTSVMPKWTSLFEGLLLKR